MGIKVKKTLKIMSRNYQLYLLIMPAFLYFLIFVYFPMYGIQIAFKDFVGNLGIWESPWVGFKHFARLFASPNFGLILKNTVGISIYSLIVGFPLPVILALFLNEAKDGIFRKVVQTVTYAPYFISVVVLVGMIQVFFSQNSGVVNILLHKIGAMPVDWLSKKEYFQSLYVLSGVWQGTGWGAIIYLARLSGVEPELHEAATIDGATRFNRMIHINIPAIVPTMIILFILSSGGGALTDTDEVKYGEGQKILIPLNDLIEKYAPNLKAYGVENPQMFPALTHSNGDIYTLPMVVPRASFFVLTSISWINQSWLKKLELSTPATTDELYTVLKAFKDQDPTANHDIIPLSGKTVLHGGILGAFGLLGTEMQVNDGVVQFNPMTGNYKEYLMYANKLYKEGILDNETFTQTDQQLSAKGAAMRLGMFSHAAPFVVVPMEHSLDYTGLMPLTSSVNNKPMTNEYNSVTRGTFALTNTNKYPKETMRWVDYLYCQDGARLAGTGVEGVDWEWKDKSKLTTTSLAPKDIGGEEYRGGHVTPDCGTAIPRAEIASGPAEDPPVIDLLANAKKISDYGVVPYPQIYYSLEDADEISTLKVDIESYVSQMEARFITGEEPFTSWDSYIDKLKKLNVEKYIQIYQKNYDANKSSQPTK